jgi:hypothetical protein
MLFSESNHFVELFGDSGRREIHDTSKQRRWIAIP